MKTDFTRKLLTAAGFAFGLYLVAVIVQPILFASRFGAFTRIAGVDVSFETATVAKVKLEKTFAEYSTGKVLIGGNVVVAGDYVKGADFTETVDAAMLTEQRGYFSFAKVSKQRFPLHLSYNSQAIMDLLMPAYDKASIVPVDASINLDGKTTIIPERDGQHLLMVESRQNILDGLANMDGTISYKITEQIPALTAAEAAGVVAQAEANVNEPITLLGDGTTYMIQVADLKSWLKITPATPKTSVAIESFIPSASDYYYLDPTKVYHYVDTLAKGIDTIAVNAKLGVVDGKVVVTAPETTGRTVDRDNAISQIQTAVTGNRTTTLKITVVKATIRADNLAELGLTELVSTGWTDFSGSSTNRVHNIVAGASEFNGVLISPDEDFSFNKALGIVDASTGYLPELVILADKTVPEYGGGLCQVSSTAFRAALNAGLPILERHAHAYPVSYYKPYGVDATIYLPTPDLRFKNDTGKYIMIQTRIEGKKLYFDFYGTKKPGTITFSGNDKAVGAVFPVEKVTPTLSEQGFRGPNSFTAVIYRHIYDATGKLTDNDKFTSKYDSPNNYPH